MAIENRYKKSNVYSFTFTVPKAAGLISFLTAGIIIWLFYNNINKRVVNAEFANFSVATTGAAGAVTSAFYVGSAIRKNALSQKEDRAIRLISVWNSEYYSQLRISALRPIGDMIKGQEANKYHPLVQQYLDENEEVEEQIITILNFLEEVSLCVNGGLADAEILESYFGYIIPRVADIMGTWMISRQKSRNSSLYEEFKILGEAWKKNLPSK